MVGFLLAPFKTNQKGHPQKKTKICGSLKTNQKGHSQKREQSKICGPLKTNQKKRVPYRTNKKGTVPNKQKGTLLESGSQRGDEGLAAIDAFPKLPSCAHHGSTSGRNGAKTAVPREGLEAKPQPHPPKRLQETHKHGEQQQKQIPTTRKMAPLKPNMIHTMLNAAMKESVRAL